MIRNILVAARRERARTLIEQEPDSHYSAASIKKLQDEIDAIDRAISDEMAAEVSSSRKIHVDHTAEAR